MRKFIDKFFDNMGPMRTAGFWYSFGGFSAVILFLIPKKPFFLFVSIPTAMLIIYLTYGVNQRWLKERIHSKQLDEAEKRIEDSPTKVKPSWDLATIKLDNYYAQNIQQIRWIFTASIIVGVIGFILIGFGVWISLQLHSIADTAMISTASGVIIEFLATVLLSYYKTALGQAAAFINTYSKTSTIGVAIQILDSIEGEIEVSQKNLIFTTKSEIAKEIIRTLQEK